MPNPLNYASREASKRLEDAGIVLETDYVWYLHKHWRLFPCKTLTHFQLSKAVPAACFTEVWRELPKGAGVEMRDGYTLCWIFGAETFKNVNPTDALVDLLIWVRKEARHG